jgi:hypothetical protein
VEEILRGRIALRAGRVPLARLSSHPALRPRSQAAGFTFVRTGTRSYIAGGGLNNLGSFMGSPPGLLGQPRASEGKKRGRGRWVSEKALPGLNNGAGGLGRGPVPQRMDHNGFANLAQREAARPGPSSRLLLSLRKGAEQDDCPAYLSNAPTSCGSVVCLSGGS